jgi:hypothetical protein
MHITEAIAYIIVGALFAFSIMGLDDHHQHNECAISFMEQQSQYESKQRLTTPSPKADGRVLETSVVGGPWENQ